MHHFLSVSVSGTSVTITPTDELGRTFDPVTYNAPALNANLSLTNVDSPDPVLVGQQVTYNLTVGNAGPRAATGTVVTQTLPAGMIFDSATPSQGTCGAAGSTVTCQLGTVGNGAAATIQVKGRPQSTGSISSSATVSSSVNDPTPGNNTAAAATTVNPAADLARHEDRHAGPGGRRHGAHLHRRGQQRRALDRDRHHPERHPARGSDLHLRHADPGQLLAGFRDGQLLTGKLANAASATVSIKVTPQAVGTLQHGQRDLDDRRPQYDQQRVDCDHDRERVCRPVVDQVRRA